MTQHLNLELARHPLFCGMAEAVVADLCAAATWVHLRSGDTLMEQGEPSDSLYILVTGRLRVELEGERFADVGVGESVGELGVLTGKPRSHRVRAVRDCRLIGLGRSTMFRALMRDSAAMLTLSCVVIERLQANAVRARPARGNLSTVAVLQTAPAAEHASFLSRLQQAMPGRVLCIDETAVSAQFGGNAWSTPFGSAQLNLDLVEWLNQMESEYDYLIYAASAQAGPWLRRCLRQADRVLLLVGPGQTGKAPQIDDELLQHRLEVPLDLVLPRQQPLADLPALRARYRSDGHHYWQLADDHSVPRIARQLCGQAVGLVLGGGGARGFAHIGLLRALEELGVRVDLLGGTSMGALIAALSAYGLSADELTREIRTTFVDNNYLNDYMIPRVALIRGRRFLQRLREIFGPQQIEQLQRPYFCVSTNLSNGSAQVHRQGELATWVATSMAVPGVSPPVGWQGQLLADGAVINSLPADIMSALACGPVLASNVSTDGAITAPGVVGPEPEALLNWKSETPRPSLISILFRTATLTSESGNRKRAEQADVCLQMPVQDIGMFQWDALDQLVERGYAHAMRELPAQLEVLRRV